MTREYLKLMHRARRQKPWRLDRRPLQLGLGGDPWRIVLACALLNRTRNEQVRPVLRELLETWEDAEALALEAELADVEEVLRPLGLQHRRAALLMQLATVWMTDEWESDWDLPTVGPYAHAALSLFVGLDRSVETDDAVLTAYINALDAGLGIEEDM